MRVTLEARKSDFKTDRERVVEQPVQHTPIPLVAPVAQPLSAPAQPVRFIQSSVQAQTAAPILSALSVRRQVLSDVQAQRQSLQREVEQARASLPSGAEQAALHRQAEQQAPATIPSFYATPPHERRGQSPSFGDVTGLYRHEVARVQQTDNGRGVQATPLRALQRQTVGQFARAYQGSTAAPIQRMQDLGAALATLQRLPFGDQTVQAALGSAGGLPISDRPVVQRAFNEADADLAVQERQDAQVHHLHALQRQLAGHDGLSDHQHVMQRVRERQGGGEALPASVRRQLEAGLNTDLSQVRVHTDGEADQLARGVQAKAFTSGRDIYFRRGQYQPNTQGGLELLAHEATHTVQQGQGRVGAGVDPDAGLEAEARQMGARVAAGTVKGRPTAPATRFSPSRPTLQRAPQGGSNNTPTPTGQAPRGNMSDRHILTKLNFWKGVQANSYLLKAITDADVQKLYQEALTKGVRDGAVALSNGQTWYVRVSDGKFFPMSGPGIINLTQQEVAFLRIFKQQMANPEQAFQNMAKAMGGQRYTLTGEMRQALNEIAAHLKVSPAVVSRVFGALSAGPHPTAPAPHPPAQTVGPPAPSAATPAAPQANTAPPTSGRVSAAQAQAAGGAVEAPTPEMLSAARAKAAGRAFKLVRWGGRIMLLVAVAADSYEIYQSHFSARVITKKAGSWAGATAASGGAAEAASPLLAAGPWGWVGYAVIVGGAGAGGYFLGGKITETIYEWGFDR